MQILKEEVRQSILEKGKIEFYQNGYEKASLRKIVKEAGTTLGNFYNYFESKEALFYGITTPAYENFVQFLTQHNEEEQSFADIGSHVDLKVLRELFLHAMKNYAQVFDETFVILIDGSKGTKYENVKGEMIFFIAQHLTEHLDEVSTQWKNQIHPDFSQITATAFLEGILHILRGTYEKGEKERLLVDYILFFFAGSMGLYEILK